MKKNHEEYITLSSHHLNDSREECEAGISCSCLRPASHQRRIKGWSWCWWRWWWWHLRSQRHRLLSLLFCCCWKGFFQDHPNMNKKRGILFLIPLFFLWSLQMKRVVSRDYFPSPALSLDSLFLFLFNSWEQMMAMMTRDHYSTADTGIRSNQRRVVLSHQLPIEMMMKKRLRDSWFDERKGIPFSLFWFLPKRDKRKIKRQLKWRRTQIEKRTEGRSQ